MNISATTKRSPIVLIRTLALIETVIVTLFLYATTLDSLKYQLYSQLPYSNSFTYDALKLLLLPLIQLIITVYAFLSWYRESYTVSTSAITHTSGVFYKKEKISKVTSESTIIISMGPIGKIFHYGSLNIENAGDKTRIILKDIPYPKNFIPTLRQILENNPIAFSKDTIQYNKTFDKKPNLNELLTKDEGRELEFKSSLRFDYKIGKINRDLEKVAMKTVAAFLNSKGGYLVLGVSNDKKIVGLSSDYPHLQHPNSDGFENHLTQIFNAMIGPEFRHLIQVSFHPSEGNDVCIIQALQSARPVYLKIDGDEKFYIRTGNTTTLLKLSEIESYNQYRFSRHIANI
ncbi:MAG: putative DNA binding domain-containing protein [bacterium]|nr:putative DNA binding domain-containing protein [bacterium]